MGNWFGKWGFTDPQVEAGFTIYLASKSRGTAVLLSSIMVLAWACVSPRVLALSFIPRRIVALVSMAFMTVEHGRCAMCLSQQPERWHQAIKARVVLHNLMSAIVLTTFLKKDELSIRHPVATMCVQAGLICFYQCPLNITVNMYLCALLASVFMTVNYWMEAEVEHRTWNTAWVVVGNVLCGGVIPLIGSVVLENAARESFRREHGHLFVAREPRRDGE